MVTPVVKHPFTSAKADGLDTTLVQPSNWNANHTITTAGANVVLGNNGSAGAVTEIAATAQGFAILAATDVPTIQSTIYGVFTTGDVKFTIKDTADSGWVLMNDTTIGDATSGGTGRANADTSALFTLIWNKTVDADCPVSTGRGANAAADFAAHKTIKLPLALGRALIGAGAAGSGLTARAIGHAVSSEETHTLITAEMPAHTHGLTDPGHLHTYAQPTSGVVQASSGSPLTADTGTTTANTSTATTGITIASVGSGTAHNNMQPSLALTIMIKL
jgi:microcystin-dependent protein